MAQKSNQALEDQALPSTALTPKSHSKITDGEPHRISSSFPHHEAALHSKNDWTMPITDRNQRSVIADDNVDISLYTKETAGSYKADIFRHGAENSNSHPISSSYNEACRSTFNVTAAENLNASFQLSDLDDLPKQTGNLRLGNNFGSTTSDVLECQDRVLGLESNSLCGNDGQGSQGNKQFSNSHPVAEDVGMLPERIQILQQNCERTMQQLFQKEEENLKLKNEVSKHGEMELRLKRECERLRSHLLQTEDRYTREALEAEEREEELRKSLAELKERMVSSSADVLNTKSSATKQVESLRSQLNAMMEERDDALQKLADVEETVSTYSSSLANLQMVLEQFQDERQSHQMMELDKCRRDLEKERLTSQQLHETIAGMQVKLDELSLAAMTVKQLRQQITEAERQMAALRDEVQAQKDELLQTKANLQRFAAVSEDTIDRALVKNLLMGFIHTPAAKRDEAFRVVGHIVGFTDDELKEIGVSTSGSWISGLSHRNSSSDGRAKIMDRSFFELFVRFLEKESTPLPSAKLPAERMAQEQLNRSSSFSFEGHSTPQPFLSPLSNHFATPTHFQSIPVFELRQSTHLSASEEQHMVTSTHTETQRTDIPIDQSVSGSDS